MEYNVNRNILQVSNAMTRMAITLFLVATVHIVTEAMMAYLPSTWIILSTKELSANSILCLPSKTQTELLWWSTSMDRHEFVLNYPSLRWERAKWFYHLKRSKKPRFICQPLRNKIASLLCYQLSMKELKNNAYWSNTSRNIKEDYWIGIFL